MIRPKIKIPFLLSIFSLFYANFGFTQSISINEVSPTNTSLLDEDQDARDWIELYNPTSENISLINWSITDDISQPQQWVFPDLTLPAKDFFLLFASGKDRSVPLNYRTLLQPGDACKYVIPNASTPIGWHGNYYNDANWRNGITGIGYGDGDDNTLVAIGTRSVFVRQNFTIPDPAMIKEIIFQVDYDDGFVAYINGVEIARANIQNDQSNPPYDAAVNSDREATIYQNGVPDKFVLEDIEGLLIAGKNTLAVQVHNVSTTSSDMSILPYLSVGTIAESIGEVPPNLLDLSTAFYHTNFKIGKNETLYLFDENSVLQDSLFVPELRNDLTVGRFPDGATAIRIFENTTPNAANANEHFLGITNTEVLFSHPSGLYDSALQVELSGATDGEIIRYTIDGTIPTSTSNSYDKKITVFKNTIVKAGIFKPDFISGQISTKAYLMDAGHDLPVLSIDFDPKDFFDEEEGIYAFGSSYENDFPFFGANFWEDLEKRVHLTYFDATGKIGFDANAGVKIFGGWSRGMPQRSLSFFFRSQYGNKNLNYPLFENRNYETYEAFILRNSGNDWQNTMLRDLTLTGLMENSNVDIQAGHPVVAYLNGEYWGFYNAREKVNEHFLAAKHRIPTEDITILEKDGEVIFGDNSEYKSLINFVNQNNLANENTYKIVADQIDLPNYIQYQLAQIYFDNTDWPGNNIKFWKHKNGQWRWILFDTDFGFGIWNAQNYRNNTINFALQSNGPNWPNPPWSTLLFRKMMTNTEFKHQFINTFADELNTRFVPANVRNKIDEHADRIRSEMFRQINRWETTTFNAWTGQVNAMKAFADSRQAFVRNHIRERFNLPSQRSVRVQIDDPSAGSVQLNTLKLTESNWTGIYFETVPITLTAIPKEGYVFDRWSGAVVSNNERISINPNQFITLTAHFKVSDQPILVSQVIFNEINYNSSEEHDAGDWVELYNNGNGKQDLSNWVFKDDKDDHVFVIPTGTILNANEYLVLTNDDENFELQFPAITNKVGNFDFKLSSNGEFIRLYNADNTLIDSVWFLPDNGWAVEANGEGPTLELINPNSDNSLAESWSTFPFNGTPGTANGDYTTPVSTINKLEKFVKIAPNPFTDNLSLTITLPEKGELQIQLLNSEGKIIKEVSNQNNFSTGTINIDARGISAGTYWLLIRMDEQQLMKQVVKAN